MTAPIEKIRRLMALALGTTSPEEARTSALIAVRLIHEHKLLDAATPAPRASQPASWDDAWTNLENMAREATRRRAARDAARPEPPPPPPPPEPVTWEDVENRTRARATNWPNARSKAPPNKRPEAPPGCVWTTAKTPHTCVWCHRSIGVNEPIMWEKKCGMHHADCWREVNP